jgi:hypothetical protein
MLQKQNCFFPLGSQLIRVAMLAATNGTHPSMKVWGQKILKLLADAVR